MLFTEEGDWWNNARLQSWPDDLDLYADGYKKAADIVARSVARKRAHQDMLVYPLVFLYRHHIELLLKIIIRDGEKLLDRADASRHGHDLASLWNRARPLIEAQWPGHPSKDLAAAEKLIREFASVDPFSTAFRYATNRAGARTLPSTLKRMNLRHLKEVVGRLSQLLSGINFAFAHFLDLKAEMQENDVAWTP